MSSNHHHNRRRECCARGIVPCKTCPPNRFGCFGPGAPGNSAGGSRGPRGSRGSRGSRGPRGFSGGTGTIGATGAAGATDPTGAGATGAAGVAGPAGATGATGASVGLTQFASFFGITAVPGNTGVDDYPALIAASAAAPSGAGLSAINFPRLATPVVGGVTINNPGAAQTDNTEFVLPSVGTYRVTWHISVDEAAQWSLWISTDGAMNVIAVVGTGGLFSPFRTDVTGNYSTTGTGTSSTVGQADLTAQMTGDVVIRNPVAGAAIQIRNFAASGGTVTVTPLPGGTQAQAVVLTIMRLD